MEAFYNPTPRTFGPETSKAKVVMKEGAFYIRVYDRGGLVFAVSG
jgi:hypothetical protein